MIIALSGYCGSGKNTLASYIESNHHKYNFISTSFAYKLKSILSNIFNTDLDYWETDKEIPMGLLNNLTKRQVLQSYGEARIFPVNN